ncbi:MAG TPA: tail fiber protein [Blastocatellia bacterium]|nr:tail fiber protein [Blastocatellia bacterium]
MPYWPLADVSPGEVVTSSRNNQINDNFEYLKEREALAGEIKMWAGPRLPTGYLWCDGSAVSRSLYADLFSALVRVSTVTITIASPAVVSWTGHGLREGSPVKFSTTGSLPTGITAGVTYYVLSPQTDSFNVAATPGGSAISTSGSQSGTHTATVAPFGDGDGSTTFNLPNLTSRLPLGAGPSPASGLTERRMGETGGSETHALATNELAAHTHGASGLTPVVNYFDSALQGGAAAVHVIADPQGTITGQYQQPPLSGTTDSTGGAVPFSIMPPFVAVNYIIKT